MNLSSEIIRSIGINIQNNLYVGFSDVSATDAASAIYSLLFGKSVHY